MTIVLDYRFGTHYDLRRDWHRHLIRIKGDQRIAGLCYFDKDLRRQGPGPPLAVLDPLLSDALAANLDTPYDECLQSALDHFAALITLHVTYSGRDKLSEAFRDLSRKCPSLRELVVYLSKDTDLNIDNVYSLGTLFPHMRRFHVARPRHAERKVNMLNIAQSMAQITPERCHCSIDVGECAHTYEEFNNLVELCRS